MKQNRIYYYNGIGLLITFLIFRVVPIIPSWSHFYYITYKPEWNSVDYASALIIPVSKISLDILNIYWFAKIVQGLIKFRKGQPKKV